MKHRSPQGDRSGTPTIPFSRPFPVDRLRNRHEVEVTIEAEPAERVALAAIDGLVRIDRLTGHFHVTPAGAQGALVSGEVVASVVQTCIVSLEPIEAEVRETVELR